MVEQQTKILNFTIGKSYQYQFYQKTMTHLLDQSFDNHNTRLKSFFEPDSD